MQKGAQKHRPRYGHIMVMFGLFLSILTLIFQGVNAPKTIAFGTSEVATLSNQYRTSAGLAPLTINSKLMASAQAKADDMAAKGYFAHDSPQGLSPWYFFDSVGYSYSTAGENLALTNQSASSVSDGWYNSPGHRANMLSATFTEVGYGIAYVPSFTYNGTTYAGVYLVAAHYALPQAVAPAPAPTTQASPPSAPAPTTSVAGSSNQASTPSQPADTAQTEPTPVPTDEQQKANEADHPAVAGNTDTENGTSTSGTMAIASTEQPKLSVRLAYAGLGIGALLVVVGSVIEIRRFLKHLPLVPHLH